jgi:hypothetical protein
MTLPETNAKVIRTLETCQTDDQRQAAIRYARLWVAILVTLHIEHWNSELMWYIQEIKSKITKTEAKCN